MLENRLFTFREIETDDFKNFTKKLDSYDLPVYQGLRYWEYYAAAEGLLLKNKKVLDIGSFYSSFPFLLQKMGAIVTASDNYQWLNERSEFNYQLTRNDWRYLLNKNNIVEKEIDITSEDINGSYDYVFCIAVLQHILDYNRAIQNLIKISKNLIITTDVIKNGMPFFNYGRFFSIEGIEKICQNLEVEINSLDNDNLKGSNHSVALIRKFNLLIT